MPALKDAQLEVFALALARGSPPRQASQEAGYDDACGEPYARATRAEVDARVTEIRRTRDGGASPDLVPLIDELWGIALDCRKESSMAAKGVAIRALAEAAKLKRLLPRRLEPIPEEDLRPILSREEWLARYGEDATASHSVDSPLAKPSAGG